MTARQKIGLGVVTVGASVLTVTGVALLFSGVLTLPAIFMIFGGTSLLSVAGAYYAKNLTGDSGSSYKRPYATVSTMSVMGDRRFRTSGMNAYCKLVGEEVRRERRAQQAEQRVLQAEQNGEMLQSDRTSQTRVRGSQQFSCGQVAFLPFFRPRNSSTQSNRTSQASTNGNQQSSQRRWAFLPFWRPRSSSTQTAVTSRQETTYQPQRK